MRRSKSDTDISRSIRGRYPRSKSSHRIRCTGTSSPKFSPDVVERMKHLIGVENNESLRWVVIDCLITLKLNNWDVGIRCTEKEDNTPNSIIFRNSITAEMRPIHRIADEYRILASRLQYEMNVLDKKRRDPLYRLKESIMGHLLALVNSIGKWDSKRSDNTDTPHVESAIIRGVHPALLAVNPKLMEKAIDCLGVDPLLEPYLLHRIRLTIEEAYFRIKEAKQSSSELKYPLFTAYSSIYYKNESLGHPTVNDIVDTDALLCQISFERIAFMRQISPSGLLYCVECEEVLADFLCTVCQEALCNRCMKELHSSGHRLDHQCVFMEQFICGECEETSAVIRCVDCSDLFCHNCFIRIHKIGRTTWANESSGQKEDDHITEEFLASKRARHCVKIPYTAYCSECDDLEGVYICVDCKDILCQDCCKKIHRAGARQNHRLLGLTNTAYSKKLFAYNYDEVYGIMNNNINPRTSLSAWMLFHDKALGPYWYNFQSKKLIRCRKYDTVPPEDEKPNFSATEHAKKGIIPHPISRSSTIQQGL